MITLTNTELLERVQSLAIQIHETVPGPHRIYGVPRGGIPVAYALTAYLPRSEVADRPESATVIVDDIQDSGATRNRYAQLFPRIPFFPLYVGGGEWVIFPWEATAEQSAEDIPTRLLQFIGEDPSREGLRETPGRYLRAWKEFTSGYDEDIPALFKAFDDGALSYDEMVVVKDIPVHSQCEHHLVPFFGTATVAYVPDGRIIGLSKINRLVNAFARRLQVQERLTTQIAEAMEEHLKPKGVGVVIRCRHMCVEARGIKQQGSMTVTSALRGVMRTDSSARSEFMRLVR